MFKKVAEFDNRVSVYWTNRHFSEKTTKLLKFYVRLGDGYIWGVFAFGMVSILADSCTGFGGHGVFAWPV